MKKKFLIIGLPIIATIIIIISLIFYVHYENTALKVSKYEVTSERISSEFNDFKIIQISDFHNVRNKKLTNSIVKNIEDEKPDIIVLTGDIVDPDHSHMEAPIEFIQRINDIAPIYYINGNHESLLEDYALTRKELIDNGVIVLDNDKSVIERNGSKINILGIADPYMAHNKKLKDKDIIRTEINSLIYDDSNYTILLSHRPEAFKLYSEYNIDLVFTGHAHGGQVRLPFIGGLYAPHQGVFPKYTSGTFTKNNTTMVVSRGIGNSFPIRINNRPDLVVVTVKSA